MKVLVSDSIAQEGIKNLQAAGFEVLVKTGMKPEELKEVIKDFDAIIVRSASKVTAEIIEAGVNLKVIGRAGVGLDNVDRQAAKAKGIKVVNTPGATSISVAELALAMMLAASRFIAQGTASLKAGKWEKKAFEGIELAGKTLGIIGCGRIGRELAKRAHALGMKVLGNDQEGMYDPDAVRAAHMEMVPRELLLKNSDYISLHLPLTPDTKYMISAPQFAIMKPSAVLVNCARGGVVEEKALYDALKEGRIKAAASDVFETEPPAPDNPLFSLDNFIGTPHIGAATVEGQLRAGSEIAQLVIDNLKALQVNCA
jgi:D-3-phosphoglycerate dehydrogenase / 2-oxoglutarate reductase